MISVDEALSHVFGLVGRTETEVVPLVEAAGRVLAEDVVARRDQPPFRSSAMDGYAVGSDDARTGARLHVIGVSAAGKRHDGTVRPGQAVRIFTGAPVPDGADRIIIQEDVSVEGDEIVLGERLDASTYVRPSGGDFRAGSRVEAPRQLRAFDLALLASMNIPSVTVMRKPVVALIATGDELVMPGEDPGPDQIIASNSIALKAMIEAEGSEARLLPIAKDTRSSLLAAFELAQGADLIVTIGGASVGDHDLVAAVTEGLGMERAFYKIAMRPGKPLMAGRINGAAMIGLPGNPVSSIVCTAIFVLPAIRAMMGLPRAPAPRLRAKLGEDVDANGEREHYMRATVNDGVITVFERQDSSLVSVLAAANALLVRAAGDPARSSGEWVEYLPLP